MEVELFSQENTQVSVFTPLDAMFAEYRKIKADILRISALILGESSALAYFRDGAEVDNETRCLSAGVMFQTGPAIRCLDAEFWSKVMQLTDVLEAMDAGRRNDWNKQIREHTTPPFEPEDVVVTIRNLLSMRGKFLAERVDGLFRNLSGEHITNTPQGFSKRMIMTVAYDGYVDDRRAEYIHDLRCVLGKFMNRTVPVSRITYGALAAIVKDDEFGIWHEFDGGAWKVKLFKKGTAHLEIHPDMAWKLNSVLAMLYPMAIPESFRRKPVKAERAKEYELRHDLVSFHTIDEINKGRSNDEGTLLYFSDPVSDDAAVIMSRIGGVKNGRSNWFFDFDVRQVIKSLFRMGTMPEQKTHQFYGSTDIIADRVMDLAEVSDKHEVLEPEAGRGGLADRLPNRAKVTCVEISQLHCDILRAKGYQRVLSGDFLVWNRDNRNFIERFDRIVMNPPFSEGRALAHLKHAADMLKPDGILVAVLPASMKDKQLIDGFQHEWTESITGAFEDTGVSVSILKLYN